MSKREEPVDLASCGFIFVNKTHVPWLGVTRVRHDDGAEMLTMYTRRPTIECRSITPNPLSPTGWDIPAHRKHPPIEISSKGTRYVKANQHHYLLEEFERL